MKWLHKFYKQLITTIIIAFAVLMMADPLLVAAANAPVTVNTPINVDAYTSDAQQSAASDTPNTAVNSIFNDWNTLGWVTDLTSQAGASGVLSLSPQDQAMLQTCQDPAKQSSCTIDMRVVNYLENLVAPTYLGGAGLPYVRANILKGYTTNGIGKYDKETLAVSEGDQLVSTHHDGLATDVSEIGQVTCKIVEKRHGILGIGGGDTTKWQKPTNIQVAWQSLNGIATIPTPTGNSLIGASQSMGAQGLMQYLNAGGNLDASLDFVTGQDLQTIGEYIGANILLKDFGAKNVQSDPFSQGVVSYLGYSLLQNAIPDLPPGTLAGNGSDDFTLAVGKAHLEDQLNLPAGTLASLGWNNILQNAGKRFLEKNLGLTSGYLDKYSLSDLNKTGTINNASAFSARTDDSLNVMPGTVAKLQSNNNQGLAMAGVNVIENAFKLSSTQRQALEKAVTTATTPTIDPTTFPVGTTISVAGLFGIFSGDQGSQNKTNDELKTSGSTIISQDVSKNVPTTTTGLPAEIINYLINRNTSFNVHDLATYAGAYQLLSESGQDASNAKNLASNPNDSAITGTIAVAINQTLGLSGGSQLNAGDVTSLFSGDFKNAMVKIGGAELEKGMDWNAGTGDKVLSGVLKLTDASQQTFTNAIATIFGLPSGSFSTDGDVSVNASLAIVEQNLGLPAGSLSGISSPQQLSDKIGPDNYTKIFGVGASASDPALYSDSGIITKQASISNGLGISVSTLQSFLQGKSSLGDIAKQALATYTSNLTPTTLANYFDISTQYQPADSVFTNLINLIKTNGQVQVTGINGKVTTVDQRQDGISAIYSLIGSVVDSGANYNSGGFQSIITAKDSNAITQALLTQGLNLFVKSIGGSVDGATADSLQQAANQLKDYFNKTDVYQTTQRGDPGMSAGTTLEMNSLLNFFTNATGVPAQYKQDMQAFLKGDFTTGLADAAFVMWGKQANAYLPANGQLTYEDMRKTLNIDDATAISNQANQIATDQKIPASDTASRQSLLDVARKQLINAASQGVQFKITDSFLRKTDPNIPVGFTQAMFDGTDAQKTAMLRSFAVNTIDQQLVGTIKGYRSGMLQDFVNGNSTAEEADIIKVVSANLGIHLGNMSATDTASLVTYLTTSSSQQNNYFTDPRYAGMWHSLDAWASSAAGISGLPPGSVESLFLAAKNGWNFDSSITDQNGNTVVASANSLGQQFVTQKLTSWADHLFGFKPGTSAQIYAAYQAYQAGDSDAVAYHLAIAVGGKDAAKYIQLYQSFQQDPVGTVVSFALNNCGACQKLFSSIDKAIQAPPGFTNQLVQGLIIFALTGNPAMLIQAALTYFFGVYEIDYLCPTPPADPYAIGSYDVGNDQISYGRPYNPATDPLPSASPAPGQKVDDWAKTVQFSDGNDQKLWMAWSRYYTGYVIDQTLKYSGSSANGDKVRQLLTYRRANAEYFQAQSDEISAAFGDIEKNNPKVGLGYTQDSTKTTNWIHVSFGGI